MFSWQIIQGAINKSILSVQPMESIVSCAMLIMYKTQFNVKKSQNNRKKKNISMTKIKATLFLCLEARIILDSHENWYEQSISSLWKTTKWIMRFFERIYSIEQRLLETSVFFEAMFYSSSLRTVRNYLAKWFFCKKLKYERIHIPKEEKRNPKTIMTQKKEKKFINWII